VVVAVGGVLQGSATTSQLVAELLFVHPKTAEFVVTVLTTKVVGFGQVGGGAQVTFAIHPARLIEGSLLNRNVKQPLASVDVKGPGIVVPQKPPASPPGTFAAALVLAICGDVMEFPLKTYKASQFTSVSNAVKVTVTSSPGLVGQIVTVESELFA